jgi:hypothetical protein
MSYEIAYLGRHLERPRVQAYLMAGWWVVNCADITCLAVNLAEETSQIGPGQKPTIVCPDCGVGADIDWPDPDTFAEINRLMSFRPARSSRNWAPAFHRQAILSESGRWILGQSVEDLARENLNHGVRI